ncbi:MAG: HAD family phosphatase [Erysipelotrichaceae bacterium]|nr:HAD family phosphatase [Erysipelotrichaceae bacterium]
MVGLFDVDGTILDSMGIYEDLGKIYLQGKGIVAKEDLNDVLYPMTFQQSASYLKNHYELDDSIDEIISSLQKYLYGYYANEVPLKEGIIDILNILKNKNDSLYIVSSSPKKLITISFQRLNIYHYFKDILTCDDFKCQKDKQFYLKVLKRIHTKANECILFEDSVSSAIAAKQCGIKVIGVKDDYARENIKNIADMYIENWRDLNENSFNNSR